jgi:hypothetical protein
LSNCFGQQRGLADIKRLTPQVITTQLDQIEGVEEDAGVVPPVADAVEARLRPCRSTAVCFFHSEIPYPVARSQRQRLPHDIARHLLAGAGTGTPWCDGDNRRHKAGVLSGGDSKRT